MSSKINCGVVRAAALFYFKMIRIENISCENILATGYPERVSTAGQTAQKGGADGSDAVGACLAAMTTTRLG
jgi:hypothetical protein